MQYLSRKKNVQKLENYKNEIHTAIFYESKLFNKKLWEITYYISNQPKNVNKKIQIILYIYVGRYHNRCTYIHFLIV